MYVVADFVHNLLTARVHRQHGVGFPINGVEMKKEKKNAPVSLSFGWPAERPDIKHKRECGFKVGEVRGRLLGDGSVDVLRQPAPQTPQLAPTGATHRFLVHRHPETDRVIHSHLRVQSVFVLGFFFPLFWGSEGKTKADQPTWVPR